MKIRNMKELAKIDRTKPYAFEMMTNVNGDATCVAYITTSEQWEKFIGQICNSFCVVIQCGLDCLHIFSLGIKQIAGNGNRESYSGNG